MKNVIKKSDAISQVEVSAKNFRVETGNIIIPLNLNVRNGFPKITTADKLLETLLYLSKKNNKNFRELEEELINFGWNDGNSQIKLVDAVDAVKAGPALMGFVTMAYKENKKLLRFCNKINDFIVQIDDQETLTETLNKYRNRFYVLIGGFTRVGVLLNPKAEYDVEEFNITATVYDTEKMYARFFKKKDYVRTNNDIHRYQQYHTIGLIGLIAYDNKSTRKSIKGYDEELAISEVAKMIYRAGIGGNEDESTFKGFYQNHVNFFEKIGYQEKKLRTAMIVSYGKDKFIKKTGSLDGGFKSAVNSIFETFTENGSIAFINNNLFSVDQELFDKSIDLIADLYANTKLNGDDYGDLIKNHPLFVKNKRYTFNDFEHIIANIKEQLASEFNNEEMFSELRSLSGEELERAFKVWEARYGVYKKQAQDARKKKGGRK